MLTTLEEDPQLTERGGHEVETPRIAPEALVLELENPLDFSKSL